MVAKRSESKRCFFCGGEIRGRSVKVGTQLVTEGPQTAPIVERDAHPDCAAMIADEEEGDE